MKSKNQRELEKYWSEQAAKKAKSAKKKTASKEDPNAATGENAAKPSGKDKND